MSYIKRDKNKQGSAGDIALAGILCALCFVLTYFSSMIDVVDLSAVILSACVVTVSVIEIGRYYPYLIWIAAGILCMLLVPRKDIALEFIMFGGIYPMIKSLAERLPKLLSWVVKIVFFNAVFTLWYLAVRFLFGLEAGFTFGVVAYLAANAFFILADVFLTMAISLYIQKIRPRIRKRK
ncbi:MAG: hypothetical protein IJT70_06820 [Clostridia bacterium]|nr:hypothetical protein [Clostridia bacterium]